MNRLFRQFFAFFLVAVFLHDQARTEEPTHNIGGQEEVLLGILATTGRFNEGAQVNIPTVGSSPGDAPSVMSGSISFVKDGLCRASVTNSGEKAYLVSIEVIGIDGYGKMVLSRTASGKVKPKSTFARDISGCKSNYNFALRLKSAKLLK